MEPAHVRPAPRVPMRAVKALFEASVLERMELGEEV